MSVYTFHLYVIYIVSWIIVRTEQVLWVQLTEPVFTISMAKMYLIFVC